MARYRKIDPRIWNDAKFRSLSDDAKLLVLFALTHPHMTSLGAMRATIEGLAAEMTWKPDRVRKAFAEPFRKGFVKYDEEASFLWFPNFLRYNGPESPNVVKSWINVVDLLPECSMKVQVLQQVVAFLRTLPKAFAEGFAEVYRKGMPNPEPEQEQEQEEDVELATEKENTTAAVLEVFAHYRKRHSKWCPKPTRDTKEWKLCLGRLAEGYSVSDLCEAIDGCHKTPHNLGENESGARYLSLALILRDAEHVARYAANNRNPPKPKSVNQETVPGSRVAAIPKGPGRLVANCETGEIVIAKE